MRWSTQQIKCLEIVILLIVVINGSGIDGSGLIDVELDGTTPIPSKDLDGTKFAIYRKKLSWDKAYEYCHSCVGKFATFEEVEGANLIRNKIYELSKFSVEYDEAKVREEFGLDRRYWIGLRDQSPTEGEWQWMSNPSSEGKVISHSDLKVYPWYPKQPDHNGTLANNNEHCAGFWNPGYHHDKYKAAPGDGVTKQRHTFNDFPCSNKQYFLCEKIDPAPTADKCKSLEAFTHSSKTA